MKKFHPDFIARVISHIPDKGQVMGRYYGLYANAPRGKVRKVGLSTGSSTAAGAPGFARGSTSAVLARGYKPRASGEPKARPLTTSS